MTTEDVSPRFADLDLWATRDAVAAMMEGQLAAAAAVQSQLDAIAGAADDAAARLRDPAGRLIYVGSGTSGRIAVLDGVELAPTYDWGGERVALLIAGGSEALMSSVEGAEDDSAGGAAQMRALEPIPSDVVIGIAASGWTPFTLAAVRTAAAAGALTIGISSNAGTPLLEAVTHPIFLDTGPEIVAGSTRMKAGTAQKIALNILSTAVMLRLGRIYKGYMVDMRTSNRKLEARAIRMVCDIAGVEASAAEAALHGSGGKVKLAVLIARGASPEQASALLEAAGDNLREALNRFRG